MAVYIILSFDVSVIVLPLFVLDNRLFLLVSQSNESMHGFGLDMFDGSLP